MIRLSRADTSSAARPGAGRDRRGTGGEAHRAASHGGRHASTRSGRRPVRGRRHPRSSSFSTGPSARIEGSVIGSSTSWTWPIPSGAKPRSDVWPSPPGCLRAVRRVVDVVALEPAVPPRQADQDGDGALDVGRVAARRSPQVASTSSRRARHPGRPIARVGEPDVPRVDVGQRGPEHPRAVRADHQRRAARPRAARQQLAVAGLVPASVEVDRAVAQERPDDRERLLERGRPGGRTESRRPRTRSRSSRRRGPG